jgi:hypothetical protein
MEVRKFKLVNSKGETCDLMQTTNFFHSVNGLGINRNDKFLRLGNRFVKLSRDISQWSISGDIAFIKLKESESHPYDSYDKFVKFITFEPLQLKYSPHGVEYTMDVVVKKLGKSEINKDGYLNCEINFVGLTPWYRDVVVADYADMAAVVPSDSLVPYQYISEGYRLVPSDRTSARIIDFTNPGTLDAKCKLKIYGSAVSPRWTWWVSGKASTTQKSGCIAPLFLGKDEVLTIDCTGEKYEIYSSRLKDGGEIKEINYYQLSDFTTERFVTFPPQVKSRFKYEGMNSRVVLEVREFYESV